MMNMHPCVGRYRERRREEDVNQNDGHAEKKTGKRTRTGKFRNVNHTQGRGGGGNCSTEGDTFKLQGVKYSHIPKRPTNKRICEEIVGFLSV